MEIALNPCGDIDSTILKTLKTGLYHTFGCLVSIGNTIPISGEAFNAERGQYLSDIFLEMLAQYQNGNNRVLGITEANLYTEGLNFVFGQADSVSGTAVISLHLLRQEYYGLPADNKLLLERGLKEAVHELGHTFGMDHCQNSRCVMHFSNSLADTDLKQPAFCSKCRPKLIK